MGSFEVIDPTPIYTWWILLISVFGVLCGFGKWIHSKWKYYKKLQMDIAELCVVVKEMSDFFEKVDKQNGISR